MHACIHAHTHMHMHTHTHMRVVDMYTRHPALYRTTTQSDNWKRASLTRSLTKFVCIHLLILMPLHATIITAVTRITIISTCLMENPTKTPSGRPQQLQLPPENMMTNMPHRVNGKRRQHASSSNATAFLDCLAATSANHRKLKSTLSPCSVVTKYLLEIIPDLSTSSNHLRRFVSRYTEAMNQRSSTFNLQLVPSKAKKQHSDTCCFHHRAGFLHCCARPA